MTLIELCEPFFLDVADLIRSTEGDGERGPGAPARPEGGLPARGSDPRRNEAFRVRRQLIDRLNALRGTAAEQNVTSLRDDYEAVRPILAFFADDVIMTSSLPFASEWREDLLLAAEPDIDVRDGLKRFFDELDAALADRRTENRQRLVIFQQCLGLGFAGIYRDSPDRLRQYSGDVLRVLDATLASSRLDKISPQAYERDERELFRPVRERVVFITVLCVCLMATAFLVYIGAYLLSQHQIRDTIGDILKLKAK